jgi:hypothetical protein
MAAQKKKLTAQEKNLAAQPFWIASFCSLCGNVLPAWI